jgi:hypothetical protein
MTPEQAFWEKMEAYSRENEPIQEDDDGDM